MPTQQIIVSSPHFSVSKYRPGREFRQKPGDGQQRPQPGPLNLALPQFIIQRHKRKLTFIAQHAALPEQPLRLLPRPGRIALLGQQVQQSLLQADTVRMLIPQQPPVNRQRYAAHGIKTAAGFAVNICHASTELTGQVT